MKTSQNVLKMSTVSPDIRQAAIGRSAVYHTDQSRL